MRRMLRLEEGLRSSHLLRSPFDIFFSFANDLVRIMSAIVPASGGNAPMLRLLGSGGCVYAPLEVSETFPPVPATPLPVVAGLRFESGAMISGGCPYSFTQVGLLYIIRNLKLLEAREMYDCLIRNRNGVVAPKPSRARQNVEELFAILDCANIHAKLKRRQWRFELQNEQGSSKKWKRDRHFLRKRQRLRHE